MPDITLSDELLDRASALLYRDWAEAHDGLKAVKAERDDRSPDWQLFHTERLHRATTRLDAAKRLLDEITPVAPLTRRA